MDRYRRVEKPKVEDKIQENEIRVTTQGKMRNYISYAMSLFQEKKFPEIILRAMGRAINKTVTVAEIIKRRIPNLHQITEIDSTDITDTWEPLEEGLDRLEMTRHVSSIKIRLSTKELDKNHPGYQPPIPIDQVREPPRQLRRLMRGRGPRVMRGRGGLRRRPFPPPPSDEGDYARGQGGRRLRARYTLYGRGGRYRRGGRGGGGFRRLGRGGGRNLSQITGPRPGRGRGGRGRGGRGGRGRARGGRRVAPPRLNN
jgi:DNA-binding protein Alba